MYVDIDIANCHQVRLWINPVSVTRGILLIPEVDGKLPFDLVNKCDVDNEAAEKLFIQILYHGSFES